MLDAPPTPTRGPRVVLWALLITLLGLSALDAQRGPARDFLALVSPATDREVTLRRIEKHWAPGHEVLAIELLALSADFTLNARLHGILVRQTGQRLPLDVDRWYEWLWSREENLPDGYPGFKARLYSRIDPRFSAYFDSRRKHTIRLDEVRWGGVKQDGIPPLRQPKMLSAADATYLDDSDVVFGLEVAGDARAYPKRILAWHEMFTDRVGGIEVTGVYCTLCGAMILYSSQVKGTTYHLGTSGFLYRSNKLMYDRATQSLWSTLLGEPVIGPLVGKGIRLERRAVVTTTWGAWRQRHPNTTVLSLDTGYHRDYSEGAAYHDYFATDRLMFPVPKRDTRLQNKAEVLGLVFYDTPGEALAIASDYLREHPVYHDHVGAHQLVVLTDASGAERVYEAGEPRLTGWRDATHLVDAQEGVWTLSESALTAEDGAIRRRLPAHNAFWFGWFSAYDHTRLVR